ncbi:hypothetical protein Glove_109g256 [Diversispora epigaea]|uniref:Uncharacterized protein n=1 Tax=Diversispora epigaea TaxID=1348612 RepID=A0A397J5L6_9GLOM|nr:hypothetical protein Glove_109g256 [Diversispora epigaea]
MKFLFTTLFTVLTFIASVHSAFFAKNNYADNVYGRPNLPVSPDSPPQAPILYHNFETIMSHPVHVYLIFYGDKWHNSDQKIITAFINGVSKTPHWGIAREYYQNVSGNIKHVTGSVEHVKSLKLNTTTFGTNINPLSTSNLVYDLIEHNRIPVNTNAAYFILTSQDVTITWLNQYNKRLQADNFCVQFCGLHDYRIFNDKLLKMCLSKHSSELHVPEIPNGKILDSMVNAISHELFEMVSDLVLSSWYDVNGQECADKCEPFFQPLQQIQGNPDVVYNLCVGNNKFLVQQIWNPRTQ